MAVSLREVAGEIDTCTQEGRVFLNRRTGEVWGTVDGDFGESEEDDEDDEDEGAEDRRPAWQREADAKAKEVMGSEEWVELPPKRDFDEYKVMADFCFKVEDEDRQTQLLRAIEVRGAFRRFKDAIYRMDIEEKWFAFKQKRLEEFAAEWLDGQGIAYGRDEVADAKVGGEADGDVAEAAEGKVKLKRRPALENGKLNELFTQSWEGFVSRDFARVLGHSLGWVGAFVGKKLVGFVNVAWDGEAHAFILDTTVLPGYRGRGIGKQLVKEAVNLAREAGTQWVHVDFERGLERFYVEACGFTGTAAGVMRIR